MYELFLVVELEYCKYLEAILVARHSQVNDLDVDWCSYLISGSQFSFVHTVSLIPVFFFANLTEIRSYLDGNKLHEIKV